MENTCTVIIGKVHCRNNSRKKLGMDLKKQGVGELDWIQLAQYAT
jgi:protein involved in sex pheromone biosynthesis